MQTEFICDLLEMFGDIYFSAERFTDCLKMSD